MDKRRVVRYGLAGLAVFAVLGLAGMALKDDAETSFDTSARSGGSIAEEAADGGLAGVPPKTGEMPSPGADRDESASGQSSAGGGVASAVPPEVAEAGATANSASLSQSLDRKIIQSASIKLDVENVGESFEEVTRIAGSVGGFVASSNSTYRGEDQFASITIRVPAERYQEVLGRLRGLGVKVVGESSEANDVTAEYTDLNSRLRNLQATESQLLTLLGRADEVEDILLVQDGLNAVRAEIEQIQGRINLLGNLSDLATIAVHLQPAGFSGSGDPNGTDIGHEVSEAWDRSIEFLTDLAGGAVYALVFAWWVPIVALPVFLIASRLLRSRRQPAEALD